MKNKKVVIILTSMILLIGGIFFTNQIYNKPKNKYIPKKNNLAIMVKGESGEYVSTDAIPKGNYVLNEDKTICENGGKVVSYNNSTGQIGFSFLGSDRCSLYFDKIIDNEEPKIEVLFTNFNTLHAIFSDNVDLSYFAILNSASEVIYEKDISGTTYTFTYDLDEIDSYYIYVDDSSGNNIESDFFDVNKIVNNKGYETILLNNNDNVSTNLDSLKSYFANTKNSTSIDFSSTTITNDGLYSAVDDLGMSYFFRGAVDDNWVKFGKDSSGKDMYWRIIRINGDGSIRMIYSGTSAPTSSTKAVMTGIGTQIDTSNFSLLINNSNNIITNPSYAIGYMYTDGEQYGIDNDNEIKRVIDNWYKTTTLETDVSTKSLVSDQIFCSDRSIANGSWSTDVNSEINFSAVSRIKEQYSPSLQCPTNTDKFTVSGDMGNGALFYPVGLITADEVMLAGGQYGLTNTSFYLYTNQLYWIGTPAVYVNSRAYSFALVAQGRLMNYPVNSSGTIGVRPVISLSKDVKFSGDGTYSNVYIVS